MHKVQFGDAYYAGLVWRETIYTLEKVPHPHRNPIDRLLVAHAIYERLPIVTPDPLIHPHPVRVIW